MNAARFYISVFLLSFISAAAYGAGHDDIAFQKSRSYSALITTHAIIYYGAGVSGADPRSLYAYRDAFKKLDGVVGGNKGLVDLSPAVLAMSSLLQKLEGVQREDQARYPDLLVGLLDTNVAIRKMSILGVQRSKLSEAETLLGELSGDIGDLLVGNQARMARVVGEYSLTYDAKAASIMDSKICEDFDRLSILLPKYTPLIDEERKRYRFVRGQLISDDYKNVTGGPALYLEKVILDLDGLAEIIAE